MADQIQVDYATLQSLSEVFGQMGDEVKAVNEAVIQQLSIMKSDAWTGRNSRHLLRGNGGHPAARYVAAHQRDVCRPRYCAGSHPHLSGSGGYDAGCVHRAGPGRMASASTVGRAPAVTAV